MFTDTFKSELEAEIKKIETLSSVEIIPVFLKSSSGYQLYRSNYALFVALLVAVLLPLWRHNASFAEQLVGSTIAYLFVLGVFSWDALLVRLVPKVYRLGKVEARARQLFLEHEVFATKDRTGLLLLVSAAERAVYVLADRGLLKKIPLERWQELSARLALDYSAHRPGDTFLQALRSMEGELAAAFPPRQHNPNELEDHLRRS